MNDFKLSKGQSLSKRLINLKNNKRNSPEYIEFAINNPRLNGVKLNKAFTKTAPFINNIQLTGKYSDNNDYSRKRIDIEYICQCGNICKAPFKDKVKDKSINKCTCKFPGKENINIVKQEYFSNLTKTKYKDVYKRIKYSGEYLPKSIKDDILNITKNNETSNILIKAPTGSGKTFSILTLFNELNIAMIVPNTMNVKQIENSKDYQNIQGLYGNSDFYMNSGPGATVSTPDSLYKISNFNDFDIVFIDEAHIYSGDYNFRPGAFFRMQSLIKDIKHKVSITATPTNSLNLMDYTHIIEYIPLDDKSIKPNIFLYDKILNKDKNKLHNYQLQIIKETERLYKENKISGKDYNKVIVLDMMYKNVDIILDNLNIPDNEKSKLKSGLKTNNDTYKSIIDKGLQDVFCLATTDLMSNGVNINNRSNYHIFIIDNRKAPKIVQFIARFRKALSLRVHIFDKYYNKKNDMNTMSFEKRINEKFKDTISQLEYYNNDYSGNINNAGVHKENELLQLLQKIDNQYNQENRISYSDKKFHYFYYDTNNKKFELNRLAIIGNTYELYYNLVTKDILELQLKEYYQNIKQVKSDKINKNKTINISIEKKEINKIDTLKLTYQALLSYDYKNRPELRQDKIIDYQKYIKKYKRKNIAFYLTIKPKPLNQIINTYLSLGFIRTGKNKVSKENMLSRKVWLEYRNAIQEDTFYTKSDIKDITKRLKKENKLEDKLSDIEKRLKSIFYKKRIRPFIIQDGKSKRIKGFKYYSHNRDSILIEFNKYFKKYNLEFKDYELHELLTIYSKKNSLK